MLNHQVIYWQSPDLLYHPMPLTVTSKVSIRFSHAEQRYLYVLWDSPQFYKVPSALQDAVSQQCHDSHLLCPAPLFLFVFLLCIFLLPIGEIPVKPNDKRYDNQVYPIGYKLKHLIICHLIFLLSTPKLTMK